MGMVSFKYANADLPTSTLQAVSAKFPMSAIIPYNTIMKTTDCQVKLTSLPCTPTKVVRDTEEDGQVKPNSSMARATAAYH